MRYVSARADVERRDWTYRFYISECLAGLTGQQLRLYDLLYPAKTISDAELPSAQDIRDRIKAKLRGQGGEVNDIDGYSCENNA